jgi:hypothetical protein
MKKSWKTTVFGAIVLALSGFQIYLNPEVAMKPEIMAGIATGAGLLIAKDENVENSGKKQSKTEEK